MIKTRATGHSVGTMTPARLPLPLTVAGSPAPAAGSTTLAAGSTTLAREATASSTDRLTALFHSHFDLVWRTVRRLGVPPEAIDDAAQEVFVIASRRLASIEPGKERAFLYGTAVRVASTARRTRSRRRQVEPAPALGNDALEPADTAPAPDELVERKRARELLDDLVARLPDDTRPVFVLYELEGLTMDEIATCLEVPPGTVASRLRRAREVFQAAVAKIDERSEAERGGDGARKEARRG
jgi:RNA polymerase sigma-70 factor (ECF subfamily)